VSSAGSRNVLRRLFVIFAILATLTVLVSAISILSLRWTIQTKDHVLERYAQVEVAIEHLGALSERRARKLRSYLLTGNPRFVEEREASVREFQAALNRVERRLEYPDEERLVSELRDANARLVPMADKLASMQERGASEQEIERAFERELQPLRDEFDEILRDLTQEVRRRNDQEARRANTRVANAVILLGSTVSLALLSAVLLGFTLYRATHSLAAEQATLARAARYQQEVMGIIGHDLRSPLAAITATASVAARVASTSENQQRMLRILRSARRIDALAAVLIDFTRFQESRHVPLVLQAGDFHELVADQVAQSRLVAGDRAVEHDRSGDGQARFDWERLGQAVQILIGQALTHATPGSTVRVRSHGEGPAVELEVVADAPPIAGELLARLFAPLAPSFAGEPMIQLSRGFSLYLARELVTAHNGTIDIRSAAGKELILRVHVPRERLAAPGVLNLSNGSAFEAFAGEA
jgi:signal transduction histidine kinase